MSAADELSSFFKNLKKPDFGSLFSTASDSVTTLNDTPYELADLKTTPLVSSVTHPSHTASLTTISNISNVNIDEPVKIVLRGGTSLSDPIEAVGYSVEPISAENGVKWFRAPAGGQLEDLDGILTSRIIIFQRIIFTILFFSFYLYLPIFFSSRLFLSAYRKRHWVSYLCPMDKCRWYTKFKFCSAGAIAKSDTYEEW